MALPPPQPAYILRGHAAQIHALEFSPTNANILSGDAEGYTVCWSLSSKRAIASWRAHTNAVLAVAWWTEHIIVTHGRDSQLYIWKLGSDLGTVLPVDMHTNPEIHHGKVPTLCHSMTVNTLNFCAFAWIRLGIVEDSQSYLLALPHTLSSEAIDIFRLTMKFSEKKGISIEAKRQTTISVPELDNPKTGLTMCLAFSKDHELLAGYESGHTIVYHRAGPSGPADDDGNESKKSSYEATYISRPHSQPVLSIQTIPDCRLYVTTSADSKLATHQIPQVSSTFLTTEDSVPCHVLDTKHSGQQGLSVRDDGLLIATAGWDGKGRIYKSPSVRGVNLDDRVIAPKEIAVLKWHKEGCYCTAFAHINGKHNTSEQGVTGEANSEDVQTETSLARHSFGLVATATSRRDYKARNTHWLALGSKDGKISLWDIL